MDMNFRIQEALSCHETGQSSPQAERHNVAPGKEGKRRLSPFVLSRHHSLRGALSMATGTACAVLGRLFGRAKARFIEQGALGAPGLTNSASFEV
ncbi:hypothetical protein CB1_000740052 [Camelus ferus]|nr:hypothetical protein CB1_000740052 [Camelus ferus]